VIAGSLESFVLASVYVKYKKAMKNDPNASDAIAKPTLLTSATPNGTAVCKKQ
jgi:hypothetical protein